MTTGGLGFASERAQLMGSFPGPAGARRQSVRPHKAQPGYGGELTEPRRVTAALADDRSAAIISAGPRDAWVDRLRGNS